jgi:hypothetical protein
MLNNVALDVAIGLVFIFLLYSLLATILQELITRAINLRGVVLVRAIKVMLEDRENGVTRTPLAKRFRPSYILNWIWEYYKNAREYLTCYFPDNSFGKVFYKHPSIKYLSENSRKTKPAYIEPGNFSTTIINILRGREYDGSIPMMKAIHTTLFQTSQVSSGAVDPIVAQIQPETLDKLRQLYIDAHNDVDRFKELVETWFNEVMDRAKGWFKRHVQTVLFFLGLGLAIFFNVDTIAICKILAKDKSAREELVRMAIQSSANKDSIVRNMSKVVVYDTVIVRIDSTIPGKKDTIRSYVPRETIPQTDSLLKQTFQSLKTEAATVQQVLGLGWDNDSCKVCKVLGDSLKKLRGTLKAIQKGNDTTSTRSTQEKIGAVEMEMKRLNARFKCSVDLYSIIGWIITALAIMLGAPFWFDLLTKLIQLRTSGAKPNDKNSENVKNASSGVKAINRVG